MSAEVPVLVVGGGAAGTVLSLELARYGVEARTIDRLPAPTVTSRAIAVHARTIETLERIDQRLADRFLANGIENKGYVLHFVDADGKRSEVRPGIDFTGLDSRYPYILVHGQSETEQYVRDYLREEFGREVEWGKECGRIEVDDEGVTATVLDRESGETETIRCRYLIACDGINSRVRQQLDLSQDESDYAGTVLQNMDVFLNDFPDVDDYIHYCAGTDHFVMVVKLPGGFYRLLLSDRGESARPDMTPEESFMRIIDQHFDGVSLGELVWHSKWESWVRLAHNYRAGNVFLAGDSAHVHSTTGGQGMNCCMHDASNLGWKLGLVMSGRAQPELLDSYEIERRPIAEQVIWAASALHEIFMGHGKAIEERAEKIRDPEFLDKVVGRCSGISYTYRDMVAGVDELAPEPGPAIGDRAPDADLADGGTLYGLTRHIGFTLFSLPGTSGESIGLESLQAIGAAYGDLVRHEQLDASAELASQYGETPHERLLLVRPDGYIGFHCRADEADSLERYLATLLIAA